MVDERFENAGLVDPLDQLLVRLRCKIDEDPLLGILGRELDHRVEALVAVDEHRGREIGYRTASAIHAT